MTTELNKPLTDAEFRFLIDNNGYTEDGIRIEIKDAVATADAPQTLKRVYTEIIQSVVQFEMVGERLIQKVRHDQIGGESVSFKWIGAGYIPDVRRSEGGEYPEFTLAMGSTSTVRAQFQQYGLVVKVTAEQIKYNQWDVIRTHITQAALALGRAKEKLIFEIFNDQGVVVFDNAAPLSSLKGVCTGRDIYGNKNGAITQNDLIDMYSQALANGYVMNTILIHPWAYPIFQKDPILRHQGYITGNPRGYLNSTLSPVNSYKNKTVDTWRKQTRSSNGDAATLTDAEMQLLSTGYQKLPDYSPLSGITIITSHLVPFDPVARTTSIIMLDTESSAILNEQAPMTVDSWDDSAREVTSVRIKESYSIDIIDKGRGVILARNVPLVANEIFNDPHIVINDMAP